MSSDKVETFPMQIDRYAKSRSAQCPKAVYLRAYEVYCVVYGEQPALVDRERGCRGGFGVGEIVAFLYAYPFPRKEWRQRVDEALTGLVV